MEKPSLNDQNTPPTDELLAKILGESYTVYEEFMKIITNDKYAIAPEWHYYNDGKVWLCKACFKKKTVFWLSVWESYFKTGFYFTEKNCAGVFDLDINESLKADFKNHKQVGKLMPLAISVRDMEQTKDVLKVIEYKKSLK
jgi:hypothetical protein